jgi:hypothetical protein
VPLSGPRLAEAVPPHSCPDWLFEAALPSAVLPGIRSQFEHRAVRRPWHPSRVCAVVTAALSFTGAHASPHAAFFSRAGPATPLSSPSIVAHRRSPSSFNAETRVSPPLSPLVRSTAVFPCAASRSRRRSRSLLRPIYPWATAPSTPSSHRWGLAACIAAIQAQPGCHRARTPPRRTRSPAPASPRGLWPASAETKRG